MVETMSEMLLGFQADRYELASAKKQLRLEWDSAQDNPELLLDDAIHRAAYKSGPLGNSFVANPEHLDSLTSHGLQAFVGESFERPGHSILGLNVDHQMLLALQQAALKNAVRAAPKPLAPSKEYIGNGEERIERGHEGSVLIAFEGHALGSPDYSLSLILYTLLGGNRPAIPYAERTDVLHLATSDLPAIIDSKPYSVMHATSGLLGIRLSLGPAAALADIKDAIERTMDRVRVKLDGLSADALERAKQMALFAYAEQLESRTAALAQLGHQVSALLALYSSTP